MKLFKNNFIIFLLIIGSGGCATIKGSEKSEIIKEQRNKPKEFTIIYDDQFLNAEKFPAEAESTKRILKAMIALDWNFMPCSQAIKSKCEMSGHIGLFLQKSDDWAEIFKDNLSTIPLLFLHYEFKPFITLNEINNALKEFSDNKTQGIRRFTGLLITAAIMPDGKASLPALTDEYKDGVKFIMPWYPTVHTIDLPHLYNHKLEIMWCGGKWNNQRLSDEKYINLWTENLYSQF